MQNKYLSLAIGLAIIISVGGLALFQYMNKPFVLGTTTIESAKTITKTFTLDDIAQHKDATSCYTTINGKVYDLTNWIAQHPGGREAILSICGKDGTAAFTGQHGTAQKQQDILVTFYIGTLSK